METQSSLHMDRFLAQLELPAQHYPTWFQTVTVLSTIAIVILSLHWLVIKREDPAIPLNVPAPIQCKDGYWNDYDALKEESHVALNQNEDSILCICPADGRVLDPAFRAADRDDIDNATQRATEAQTTWAETTFAQRRQVLRTLLRYVLDHQEDIVTACCLDSGKTRLDAYFGEILVTVEKLKWTIEHGEKALTASKRPSNFLMFYKANEVRYEPLGVVSACVSWNYPFHNFIGPVISAIFAGNAIVVKPSEQVAWSSKYFLDMVRGAIAQCGHKSDIIQSVVCLPKHADYLTSHPGLSYITFIGSREIAFKVCASAAKALTPVCVELGGKDPAIVLDDRRTIANIEDVARILMRGVFQNAGQNCIGIERVIALPGVYDKIIDIVKPKIESMKVGSVMLDERQSSNDKDSVSLGTHSDSSQPSITDMGSLVSPRTVSELESLISSAVSSGATLHHGGMSLSHPRYPKGYYFTPTLLSGVTPDMSIAQKELFAPVFVIMRAESIDDAIRIANSSPYALGASVWGYDDPGVGRVGDVEKLVKGVKAGMVAVNDFGTFYATSLPFGGVGGSGYGRFGGAEGLQALCNLKSVCKDRWNGNGFWVGGTRIGWPGIATKIPWLLDLPAPKEGGSIKARDMVRGVVTTGYGMSIKEQGAGVLGILGALDPAIERVVRTFTGGNSNRAAKGGYQ